MSAPVLLTWLATRNDPYERASSGGAFRTTPDGRIPGPTLTLLTDPTSPYANKVTDVVVLRQGGPEAASHDRVYADLCEALESAAPAIRLHPHVWDHPDPTDHAAIYDWLRTLLPQIRRKFSGREIVVHLSPGTAAMHTVWVLMAETGFIEAPFTVVQSYRASERHGRAAVVPVSLGVETFFKRWQDTRPSAQADNNQSVAWDPRQFRSARLASLYADARRVARLKVPVLILGERGTGKTTLASWIRIRSPFRKTELDEAWPSVPCGQYSPETMRSELFGYAKGAFTGATHPHDGLLGRASGDTLFLDEIGDVSRDLQRLLIKVVEEGTYQPVGSIDTRRTDLRLLTATNLPVDQLCERLDPDFLDRISAFTLTVPPLREVPEELTWLWPTVLEKAALRSGVDSKYANLPESHHAHVLKALRASPLRGNVRDLFRVAWRFLAARADDEAPLTVRDAIDYAIEGLDGGASEDAASRTLARAFADRRPLDATLVAGGPIDAEALIKDFKFWFGNAISELSDRIGKSPTPLHTLSDRTLRNWRQKKPADDAE